MKQSTMRCSAMRAGFRALMGVLIFLAALAAGPVPARAVSVVYDGTAQSWHAEDVQDDDLFMSFDGVMPGDVLVHEFDLRVDSPKEAATIYVQLEGDKAATPLFDLLQARLLIDGREVASGSLGSLVGEPVRAGAWSAPATLHVKLQIEVPTSLGNEFQQASRPLGWRFTAQEEGKPSAPSAGSQDLIPQTGDNSRIGFILLGVAGIAVLVAGILLRRKRD